MHTLINYSVLLLLLKLKHFVNTAGNKLIVYAVVAFASFFVYNTAKIAVHFV